MKHFTKLAAAGALAASAAFTATDAEALDAPFLNGVFDINIYSFDAGGDSSKANADASTIAANTLTDTVTWTGLLDFNVPSGGQGSLTTIQDFFDNGTGTVTSLSSGTADLILSGGAGHGDRDGLATTDSSTATTFRETTLFEIAAASFNNISNMSQILEVTHDDGFTLSDGISSVANPGPTVEDDTTISGLTGGAGAFDLIYVAANGDPSVLEVSVVPLPAAAWLLMFASGGLIAVKRRQAKKAA